MAGKYVSILPKNLSGFKSKPKIGHTINGEKHINGKVPVHMTDGSTILVDWYRLRIIGYYD